MFSRKEKPTGKRPPSTLSNRSHTSDDSAPSGRGSRLEDRRMDGPPLRPVIDPTPRPMALPSIPRVASQYGAHGPVNMSELERKLMSFQLDESKMSPARYDSGMQWGNGRVPRTHLETIQDTEAQLTGSSRLVQSSQASEMRAPPRQRVPSSNFSRPRLLQSPPTSTEAPKVQRPPADQQVRPPVPRQPESTVRLVQNEEPPIHVPVATPSTGQDPRPQPAPPRQPPPAQWRPHPPTTRPPAFMPPPEPPTSTVPPPPLRRPPPPPSTQSAPVPIRPKTAPSDPAITPEFKPPPDGAESAAPRPVSRGLRPFRRSTEETPPQTYRAPAPPPLLIPPKTAQSAAAYAGEPSGQRPPSAKWSLAESTATTIASPAEAPSTKSSKTVRSRFNPISLITRRKTGQTNRPAPTEPFSPPLPDDFDPRIRGNVVHDFSAPRSRTTMTSPPSSTPKFPPRTTSMNQGIRPIDNIEPPVPKKPSPSEQPRTPVFIENFGEDTDAWRLNEKDRRNQDTTGIAGRVPEQLPKEMISSMPVFARRPPPNSLAMGPAAPPPQGPLPPTPQSSKPTTLTEAPQSATADGGEPEPPAESNPPPAPQTPPTGSRSPSVAGSGGLLAPTPARLKSNASSRFSFDLAGVGSAAQEKLLEEKHRERNSRKVRESVVSGMSIVVTDDEDNGYDDIGFDDFEEDIPGMNSDDDDFPHARNVSDFVLPPSNPPGAAKPSGLQNSWNLSQPLEPLPSAEASAPAPDAHAVSRHPEAEAHQGSANDTYRTRFNEMEQRINHSNVIDDDDDFYFDDGDFDTADGDGESFNESVFDDEENTLYGVPLRDQKKLPSNPQDTTHSDSSQQSTRPMSLDSAAQAPKDAKATTDTSRTSVQPADAVSTARKPPTLDTIPQGAGNNTASLTQDNLAAYHDALAYAANKAAKEGRFERKSLDENSSDADAMHHRPHVSFQDPHPLPLTEENVLDFDFDDLDDIDDDDVIAAANAEALENDDEGIYGHEFGFYASGSGNDAERVHGGYFGSSFNDMVKRSHSGRAKDPSLTPITERSEWSQRNSMISLALQQSGSERWSAAHTPGLAQLADSMQYESGEDNMSLSALMKLRRGAFGDSNTSLPSSAGSHKSGSPGGFMFPQPPTLGPAPHTAPLPRNNSASNLAMGGPPELPVRLPQFSGPGMPILSPTPPVTASGIYHPDRGAPDRAANPSPNRRPVSKTGHHSRNSSGAESVTYIKERDDDGGQGRWVMERRRTSEAGEVEILGRQVLEGQRI